MSSSAVLSECRTYRYELHRSWNETLPRVLFIGLNPSTADEVEDDPTIRKCIRYAKAWGYGSLTMANLFAYRATDPRELLQAADPVGPENNNHLFDLAKKASIVIAVWGNYGVFLDRSNQVRSLISNLYCLKVNETGGPAHPLYLSESHTPVRIYTNSPSARLT